MIVVHRLHASGRARLYAVTPSLSLAQGLSLPRALVSLFSRSNDDWLTLEPSSAHGGIKCCKCVTMVSICCLRVNAARNVGTAVSLRRHVLHPAKDSCFFLHGEYPGKLVITTIKVNHAPESAKVAQTCSQSANPRVRRPKEILLVCNHASSSCDPVLVIGRCYLCRPLELLC